MPRRSTGLALAIMGSLALTISLAPRAFAAPPLVPMPGERFLSQAELTAARSSMGAAERALIGPLFEDQAEGIVLSYERRLFRIRQLPDGRQVPEEMAPVNEVSGSTLRIPLEAIAGFATKEDLYISLTVVRTRGTSPYEWQVVPYAEWRGLAGMHVANGSADVIALAWAGGLPVHRQTDMGQYRDGWPCNGSALDIWPSDASPNTGTAFSFAEFGAFGCPMRWAAADVRLRQKSWQNRLDGIVFKYFHTWSGLTYSVSFGKTPSISISPTKEQWALALNAAFSH